MRMRVIEGDSRGNNRWWCFDWTLDRWNGRARSHGLRGNGNLAGKVTFVPPRLAAWAKLFGRCVIHRKEIQIYFAPTCAPPIKLLEKNNEGQKEEDVLLEE